MKKKHILFLTIFFLIFPVSCCADMPPEQIVQKFLKADSKGERESNTEWDPSFFYAVEPILGAGTDTWAVIDGYKIVEVSEQRGVVKVTVRYEIVGRATSGCEDGTTFKSLEDLSPGQRSDPSYSDVVTFVLRRAEDGRWRIEEPLIVPHIDREIELRGLEAGAPRVSDKDPEYMKKLLRNLGRCRQKGLERLRSLPPRKKEDEQKKAVR